MSGEREKKKGRRRKGDRPRSSRRAQVRAPWRWGGAKMDPRWVIYSGPVGSKGAGLSPPRTP